jgi:hypothetical protein
VSRDVGGPGSRRFPAPWRTAKITGGYVVRDANGWALAYLYSRGNEAEAQQAKMLTKDEARRIARNIARLPELLGKAGLRATTFTQAHQHGKTPVAALLAQFNRVFAPSPSSRCTISELKVRLR